MKSELYLRSLTYTVDLFKITQKSYRSKIAADITEIKNVYKSKGIKIRTVRFNVIKIDASVRHELFSFLKLVESLSQFSESIGIRWFNIAFDLLEASEKNSKHATYLAYEILKRHSQSFINLIVANDSEVNPIATLEAVRLVGKVSRLSWNGFDNFRLGISVNPATETPFFPFSYSDDRDLSYSVAVELTQPLLDIIKSNSGKDLELLRDKVINDISPIVHSIEENALSIGDELGSAYKGQDISLAPYPDSKISVIKALHLLGLKDIGENGTMFFTAYLTSILKCILKNTGVRAVGFNGVMYSLLEDHLMCESNNMKTLDINKIISYSSLCGCGLDMVPIPGNFLIEDLGSIVIDVATIAIRHQKPLGIRALPIPNKYVNEFTEFDSDFLTNTRVMDLNPSYIPNDFFKLNKMKIL